MYNKKLYIGLYYFSFIGTIILCLLLAKGPIRYYNYEFYLIGGLPVLVLFLNILLTIVFTILLIVRKNIVKPNILFPIIYIVFILLVLLVCHLFNGRVLMPYMHYSYYIVFIIIDNLLLNVYSLLSIEKKSK